MKRMMLVVLLFLAFILALILVLISKNIIHGTNKVQPVSLVPTATPTIVLQKEIKNTYLGIVFQVPQNWVVNDKKQEIELCPPGYNVCFTIKSTPLNFQKFIEQIEADTKLLFTPTGITIGKQYNLNAESLFRESQTQGKNYGYYYIYHQPKNIVILHSYNDSGYSDSVGAVLQSLEFLH